MALCAYGLKCGISERRIRQDAYSFLEHLESLTDDEDNHFTREDVKDALKALKADNKLLSTMASREWIEKQTKVVIPPNKRNGRKQEQHLQLARGIRALKEQMGENVVGGGRPDKAKIVEEWRKSHPEGRKATAFVILDWIKRQCTNGGAWAKPSKAFPLNYPRAIRKRVSRAVARLCSLPLILFFVGL